MENIEIEKNELDEAKKKLFSLFEIMEKEDVLKSYNYHNSIINITESNSLEEVRYYYDVYYDVYKIGRSYL